METLGPFRRLFPEPGEVALAEKPPVALLEGFVGEAADANALEADDLVSEGGEHEADLALEALAQRDAELFPGDGVNGGGAGESGLGGDSFEKAVGLRGIEGA